MDARFGQRTFPARGCRPLAALLRGVAAVEQVRGAGDERRRLREAQVAHEVRDLRRGDEFAHRDERREAGLKK